MGTRTKRRVAWAVLALGAGYAAWNALRADAPTPEPAIGPHPLAVDAALPRTDRVPAEAGALAGSNLVLVTLDTTRADRLACYGNPSIRTPNLDGLAAGGVVFSHATAVAPLTLVAHASILTGLYPVHHGVRANGFFRLDETRVTLAERLRARGYRTGAVVSAFVLDGRFGLAQGFEHYDDDLSEAAEAAAGHYRERSAARTTERALRWLEGVRGERFFLWVHYFDPHHAYEPPSPFAEEYRANRYDGEIAYVDSALGTLLDGLAAMGQADHTLVAVVGDHGEGLGQHDETTHAYLTYESTLRVPLILSAGEGLGGGVCCTRPVSQVDVAPLLLALLGLSAGDDLDGEDLLAPAEEERPCYFETLAGTLDFGWEPLVGVSLGDRKLVESSRPELYDLARDPEEHDNLAEREPETVERLRGLLEATFGDLAAAPSPTFSPDAEEARKLADLGYLGGGASGADGGGARELPQAMMPVLNRVMLANDPARPAQERVAELEDVVRGHPDFFPAWKALGDVCREVGSLDQAERALKRCVELRPGTPEATFELALVLADRRRHAEVVPLLAPVVRRYPSFVDARYLYGTVLAGLGRLDEAIVHLRAVLDLDPDHERTVEHLAMAYDLAKRGAELPGVFEEHLARDPRSTKVRLALAGLYARQGETERAERLLRAGVAADPDRTAVYEQALATLSAKR